MRILKIQQTFRNVVICVFRVEMCMQIGGRSSLYLGILFAKFGAVCWSEIDFKLNFPRSLTHHA
jgi:hypothetical protein